MGIGRKVLLILICLCFLALPVAAASEAEDARCSVVVSNDGSCVVTLHYQLRLETEADVVFWLPENASEVRLNGRYKTPGSDGQRLSVTLEDLAGGVHTVDLRFELPDVLKQQSGAWWLEVPLLPGIPYPIGQMEFSVVLPGETEAQPLLSSGYYGEGIAADLQVSVQGSTISGSTIKTLKDRETLTLRLPADMAMFSDYSQKKPLLSGWELAMAILVGGGCLYYLAALLPGLPRKTRAFGPPDGINAGEIGTCLTGCGTDLTMMVFTWAQLGYVHIHLDDRGRVLLHRQMDMGNERSKFENHCFQSLFAQRDMVDGSGLHYALLCRKLAGKSALLRQLYKSHSGNPKIVRLLALAAGTVSGVLMSFGVYTAGAGTVFLALGMALLCGGLSYLILSGSRSISLGNKLPMWAGAAAGVLWILMGVLCNRPLLGAAMVLYEALTGLASAMGGRRSSLGQQYAAQVRGLRAHLTRTSVFEMQQLLQRNPDYFFELMPYALALGVEKPFARRFGKTLLPDCCYVTLPSQRERTAAQWAAILRQIADRLDRRQKQLQYEKLLQQAGELVKPK